MSLRLASRLPQLFARQHRHTSIAAAAASRSRLLQPLLILPLILSSAGFASARSSKPKSNANAAAPSSSSTLPPLSTPDFEMAWRCSGESNRALVDNLRKGGIIESDRVAQAMLAVDRGLFCPRDQHGKIIPPFAYQDSPQYLGFGATISAPHMHVSSASAHELFAPSQSSTCAAPLLTPVLFSVCCLLLLSGDGTGAPLGSIAAGQGCAGCWLGQRLPRRGDG